MPEERPEHNKKERFLEIYSKHPILTEAHTRGPDTS